MNLHSWIKHLNHLHVRSIDLELGRMQRVAKILQIKQPSCSIVTVAGTNGKGSVVSFLEALYVKAGYKVAAYTSPYLISFNEQFRFNQQSIDDKKLCHYFEKIDHARGDITLTLFEFKTLAALLYFADVLPDLMLLEVGLGGRLDSVNMIDPDVAVITSISLDHCDWLGNTRELIGREKAGIFRAGKPAVCGDLNPPVTIQAVADELNTPIFYRNKDFYILEEEKGAWSWHSQSKILKNLPQPFLLKDNIATALQVVELLRLGPSLRWGDRLITEQVICDTIATTAVPGRQHIISHDPFIVVDVSHNEDSVRRLAAFLDQHQKKNMTVVFSVLKTKDFASMARVILPYIKEWHIAEINHPNAMPLEHMQKILHECGAKDVVTYSSITKAYKNVFQLSGRELVAFGSFHVVGEILECHANNFL
jgi:dihydrofolate synthase/folylpolyglutamate synthase